MRNLFRKTHRGEKGFTLVELLVVFTLLALLAAIAIPNISSLVSFGETESQNTELSVIQTAMDCMMAVEQLGDGEVTPVASWTNNMSSFPTEFPLYPKYVRFETTEYWYECTANGTVSQDADGS